MLGELTVNVRESRLGLVSSLGGLTRPHEHIGHRQHGGDGQDLVGAPAGQHSPQGARPSARQPCSICMQYTASLVMTGPLVQGSREEAPAPAARLQHPPHHTVHSLEQMS